MAEKTGLEIATLPEIPKNAAGICVTQTAHEATSEETQTHIEKNEGNKHIVTKGQSLQEEEEKHKVQQSVQKTPGGMIARKVTESVYQSSFSEESETTSSSSSITQVESKPNGIEHQVAAVQKEETNSNKHSVKDIIEEFCEEDCVADSNEVFSIDNKAAIVAEKKEIFTTENSEIFSSNNSEMMVTETKDSTVIENSENIISGDSREIQQENIKSTLKEIISEIEQHVVAENPDIQQIANELNQVLKEQNENKENEQDRAKEASGHKVNIEDGLGHGKPIDLEKLFTPASDSGEATPSSRNRKMYASSSFYTTHHPTVEEQFELARRISSSLSDISNQQSKGQSMYVNRKKRSVKWVHEGEGQAGQLGFTNGSAHTDEISSFSSKQDSPKPSLKLVMDPRGQVQDLSSLRKQGYQIEPALSPEVCFDLVRDLNSPRGKGAELFAKRRKKSEKWIVDENNVKTVSSTLQDIQTSSSSYQSTNYQASSNSSASKLPPPSYLKNASQRVESIQRMNEIQERFNQPRVRLVQSPWDAALSTGSVDAAFQDVPSRGTWREALSRSPIIFETLAGGGPPLAPARMVSPAPISQSHHSPHVDVYKPKPPQGWAAPSKPAKLPDHQPLGSQKFIQPPTESLTPKLQDVSSLNNFNTAPRGWAPKMDYYRPVFLDPAINVPTFTDF